MQNMSIQTGLLYHVISVLARHDFVFIIVNLFMCNLLLPRG